MDEAEWLMCGERFADGDATLDELRGASGVAASVVNNCSLRHPSACATRGGRRRLYLRC